MLDAWPLARERKGLGTSCCRRYGLRNRAFPGTVRDASSSVTGKLLMGLNSREMYILDEYEDDDYDRVETVAVEARGEQPRVLLGSGSAGLTTLRVDVQLVTHRRSPGSLLPAGGHGTGAPRCHLPLGGPPQV